MTINAFGKKYPPSSIRTSLNVFFIPLTFTEVLDINMMLIGGFGFLMTFLKKHGFSSLGLTIMIVVFCTEWSILLRGFTKINATSYYIKMTMMEYVSGVWELGFLDLST